MAAKKKSALSKLVVSALMAIPELIRFINNIATIIQIEARTIGKKLALLLILSFLAITLLITIWIGVCCMAFFWLLSLQLSLMMSLVLITSANIILLALAGLSMLKVKNHFY